MPLPSPRLDDRTYDQLVESALARATATCPDWTDHNPGDPGVTLLETFAFLTEALLYRLNRVPSKLYIALLNLAGIQLRAPGAAAATLTFSRTGAPGGGAPGSALTIPAGTKVTAEGGIEFVTTGAVTLPGGAATVDAPALHCTLVEAELLGAGNGQPGQSLRVKRAPIIAPTGDALDFVLAVQAAPGEELDGAPTRGFADQTFCIWREIGSFADAESTDRVYRLDRAEGRVQFAPAMDSAGTGPRALAALPPANREIRAWYRTGGGRRGNVAAGTLKTLASAPAGITVVNAGRAAGGADGETVDEALARGPLSLATVRCAVTARDFEHVALSVGGVARALAYAQAQRWSHAEPGVVEVLLVPVIDAGALPDKAVTADVMIDYRREELRLRAATALDDRRPLGIRTAATWTRVRPVSVSARVVVGREVDPGAIGHAVSERINTLLSPFRDVPFGQQLRAADIYETIMAQPGVRYADQLRFTVGEAPDQAVTALVRDPYQRSCWFAASDVGLYRSLDDGDSWSRVFAQPGEKLAFVRPHHGRAGVLAAGVVRAGGSAIHISYDTGETWTRNAAAFDCDLSDADWVDRDGAPMLLIATAEGLRQFAPRGGAGPAPVVVDAALDSKGFYAVASSISASGVISVAVAAREEGGVYASPAGGVSGTFHSVGLAGKDVRVLEVQQTNARAFLWAGAFAEAGEQGEGAFRLELRASGVDDPDGFKPVNIGWQGGSCQAIAFADAAVFAGSNRAGVLRLDSGAAAPAWQPARLDAGLPIRDTERLLQVVAAVAAAPQPGAPPLVFSGGVKGVHVSDDGGNSFRLSSATLFTDRIPLPPDWLYCADTHQFTVVADDDGRR